MDLSRMNQGGGDFELTPEGVHNAVCYAVIDLGTQEGSYMGKPKIAPKILLKWEIDERMEDGRRFMVQQRYTASMNQKAILRKTLEAWRGVPFKEADFKPGGFSMRKLLGAGCQLQIVHVEKEDKTYANIAAIMKLGKGMAKLAPEIEPFMVDLETPQTFDREAYEGLSDSLKELIAKSPEFQALSAARNGAVKRQPGGMSEAALSADLDDEIPF